MERYARFIKCACKCFHPLQALFSSQPCCADKVQHLTGFLHGVRIVNRLNVFRPIVVLADSLGSIVCYPKPMRDAPIVARVQVTADIVCVECLYDFLCFKVIKQILFPSVPEDEDIADNLIARVILDNSAHLSDVPYHIRITATVHYGYIVVLAILQPHFVAVCFNATDTVKTWKVYYVFKAVSLHSPIRPRARKSTKLPSLGKLYIYTAEESYTILGLRLSISSL